MRPEPCLSWCAPDALGNCRYCGWPRDRSLMPVTMYDATLDRTREVTQQDVDALLAVQQAYGALRTAMAHAHARLLNQRDDILRRGTPVVDVVGMRGTPEGSDC